MNKKIELEKLSYTSFEEEMLNEIEHKESLNPEYYNDIEDESATSKK